jgi:hypothetical protein
MAIWHFKFSLSPTTGLLRVLGRTEGIVPEHVSSPEGPTYIEGEEFPNYWDDPSALRQAAMVVSSFLPEMRSWSPDARMFGDDENDRVEVWDDDIRCRMNMRMFDYELMDQIFELAKRFDCKIVVGGSGEIVEPNLIALGPHVQASNAYKFCLSPIEFLKSGN